MKNFKNSFGKMPMWAIILICVLVTMIVCCLGFYFLYIKTGGYVYNLPQYQNINNNTNGIVISSGKSLNLSNRGLTSIPNNVFNQTNLEELNVSYNSLTGSIQSQIGQLKNLKVLNASYNKMTGVPAEIGQLKYLEVLDLSYNQLTGLPNELGNLKNLKTLNLKGNSYSQQDLDGIKSKLPATVNIITGQ